MRRTSFAPTVGASFIQLFIAFGSGCDGVITGGTDADEFFASCDAAPDPTLPADCSGPDSNGWSNQLPPQPGPCPEPPPGGCTQVVVGRLTDTRYYIDCPGYIVLNRSDWTITLNDNFIACAAACDLGTCDSPVILVSDRASIPDFSEDNSQTTITSRELCQFHNAGCDVVFADQFGPGYVDCGCSPDSIDPTGACCANNSSCFEATQVQCDAQLGFYGGDGSTCAGTQCASPAEYVIWYTGNVCCWGAPHLLITDRDRFNQQEPASSFEGGGLDPSIPVEKVELQGGFASPEEATAWVCPQFVSSSFHYWCGAHYQMAGSNWWLTGGISCDFSTLPQATETPDTDLCN